jgi:Zn-dependent peptidase ImmA (M78 family)
MAKSFSLKIVPEILEYARKYSGFHVEDVAKKTKISVENITAYEGGLLDVPINHVEKLSVAYKRPLAFFLLPEIPQDAVEPKDFRIVYSNEDDLKFSPGSYLAIRRARYIQSVLQDIAGIEFDYKIPSFSISDDLEKSADWLRDFLKVDLSAQAKWGSPSIAFRAWKDAVENRGIFVLQQNLTKDDISAFCLVDKKPYVIMLNSAEHEHRRIFSLFHEIGHILLHTSGICTPDNLSRNSFEYRKVEMFCNQFASSVLIPKLDFLNNQDVRRLSAEPFEKWLDEDLNKIARRYRVSPEVVLRRFLTIGFIDEEKYNQKRTEWAKKQAERPPKKKGEVRIPQHIKCLSQNGRGISSLVINQYHSKKISYSSAAEILNIKPKYMPRLEAAL